VKLRRDWGEDGKEGGLRRQVRGGGWMMDPTLQAWNNPSEALRIGGERRDGCMFETSVSIVSACQGTLQLSRRRTGEIQCSIHRVDWRKDEGSIRQHSHPPGRQHSRLAQSSSRSRPRPSPGRPPPSIRPCCGQINTNMRMSDPEQQWIDQKMAYQYHWHLSRAPNGTLELMQRQIFHSPHSHYHCLSRVWPPFKR
jgi:hypothetical protein